MGYMVYLYIDVWQDENNCRATITSIGLVFPPNTIGWIQGGAKESPFSSGRVNGYGTNDAVAFFRVYGFTLDLS